MSDTAKSVLLIGIVVVLGALVLLPGGESDTDDGEHPDESSRQYRGEISPGPDLADAGAAPLAAGASAPAVEIPHPLLPLVAGSTWTYGVKGPDAFVTASTWTLEIAAAPTADGTVAISFGFDDERTDGEIKLSDGSLTIDTLPFVEPLDFVGNRPNKVSGEYLPPLPRVVQGAVWAQDSVRVVPYRWEDDDGVRHDERADARMRERATVKGTERVKVPAGQFAGFRIDWLTRIEIEKDGRPVLQELTEEPFRREQMWIVDGIGIVRRVISYPGHREGRITFDLVRYFRP